MNQLAQIVQTSGLEKAESQSIIEKFGSYEAIAKEWEDKAKAIVVTDASQTVEMEMAKVARKKFSDLRIDIEKSRKAMKEQSLRKGQAIDAIARFLVSLIAPIEEHLKTQEDFIKIQQAKRLAELEAEADRRIEAERIAKEKAEREEQERIRVENERLRLEAEKRGKEIQEAKAKADAKMKALEEKARKQREALEAKARVQREKAQKTLDREREQRDKLQRKIEAQREKEAKAEAEKKAELKRIAKAEAEAKKAPDKEKALAYINALLAVQRPEVQDPGMQQAVHNVLTILADIRDDITNS